MSFEDLDVWKRGKDAAIRACQLVEHCSSRSFADQVIRSAVSVPSNIAEGAERNSKPEFIQFLGYARGSAGELRTQIMIGIELKYVSTDEGEKLVSELREISRMLWGLIRSLRTQ
jgi:four helix bundle protein